MMKVYFILSVTVCIFFVKTYSMGLGPDPFSRGKACSADSDCNTALGVTCCGAGAAWGRCCPDGLCTNCTDSDSSTTFQYCGTYCPDHAKTTQTTPAYLSTTTTAATTTTTASNATTTTSATTTASNSTATTTVATTTASNDTTTTASGTTTTASGTTTTASGTTT